MSGMVTEVRPARPTQKMDGAYRQLVVSAEVMLQRELDDCERAEFARLLKRFRDEPHRELIEYGDDDIILSAEYVE